MRPSGAQGSGSWALGPGLCVVRHLERDFSSHSSEQRALCCCPAAVLGIKPSHPTVGGRLRDGTAKIGWVSEWSRQFMLRQVMALRRIRLQLLFLEFNLFKNY